MPWVVAAAAVGAVGAYAAADKGADAMEDASNQANETERSQYAQNRADAQPWRDAGEGALGQLVSGTAEGGEFNQDFSLSDFTADPGYEFRMREGQRAMDAGAAARGGALSGAAVKGAQRYGQDLASGEYQNAYNRFNADRTQRFNRLSSLAGTGQTATRDVANQGTQMASNVANNMVGAGNAAAAGYVAQGNTLQSTGNSLGNWYMQNQYMNKAFPQQQSQQQWYGNGGASSQRGPVGNSVTLSDGSSFEGYN